MAFHLSTDIVWSPLNRYDYVKPVYNTSVKCIHINISNIPFQAKISKATMMCVILESLISDLNCFDAEKKNINVKKYICQSFIFSYLWALGSNLIDSSQSKFEELVFNQFKNNTEANILPEIKLFNVYLHTVNKTFENWNSIVPDFKYNTDTSYFELLVPTVDSIRYTYVVQKLIQMNQPVMLVGVSGK